MMIEPDAFAAGVPATGPVVVLPELPVPTQADSSPALPPRAVSARNPRRSKRAAPACGAGVWLDGWFMRIYPLVGLVVLADVTSHARRSMVWAWLTVWAWSIVW